MQGIDTAVGHSDASRLLQSVAEQLKSPLSIIARTAELGELTGSMQSNDAASIQAHATTALTLVESYLLGLQLLRDQTTLLLEPVSVSSLLVEVAHELQPLAQQYRVDVDLRIAGKYEPVMAHPKGLKLALLALGASLLEGYRLPDKRLLLAVHRTHKGIVTGLYGAYHDLHGKEWRRALQMKGLVDQPLGTISTGSAAGLFIADAILRSMDTNLRVGKHLKQYGVATILQPSQQLQFV